MENGIVGTMIDPLCIKSMKNKEPCAICSGTVGKIKVHTMKELVDAGYVEPKKESKK